MNAPLNADVVTGDHAGPSGAYVEAVQTGNLLFLSGMLPTEGHFYDYRTNVDAYPRWRAWLRQTQPRPLVIWGKCDLSFDLSEP